MTDTLTLERTTEISVNPGSIGTISIALEQARIEILDTIKPSRWNKNRHILTVRSSVDAIKGILRKAKTIDSNMVLVNWKTVN